MIEIEKCLPLIETTKKQIKNTTKLREIALCNIGRIGKYTEANHDDNKA
jgi:hypothetical protein